MLVAGRAEQSDVDDDPGSVVKVPRTTESGLPVGENMNSSMSKNAIQWASSRRFARQSSYARCWPGKIGQRSSDHDPLGDVGFEHGEMVVIALVVVQIEALEPDQQVELDPLP